MAITTAEAFLEVLEKSQLLTPEQLADARDSTLLTDDAEQFSQILIDQGRLTGWQTSELLAGRTQFFLGNYVLLELLGRGGMGSVYLARHTTMNREVALKIVSKKLGKDPASIARFLSEGRASASLDHPNIVRAYDVGKERDRFYIVMEYVPGHDLEELAELEGPLPLEFVVDCIRQAAEGLAHAHSRGMIHCDIKPSNLLVSDQGVVKILDMGMARLVGENGSGGSAERPDHRVLGTVDFMAPEQALHGPKFDHRADIYALGCTLYFLLAGRPPFAEGGLTQRILKHQTEEPPDLRQFRPDVPEDLVEICAKMMAKDPDARFQSAGEISGLLKDWRPKAPAAGAAPSDRPVAGGVNLASMPLPAPRRKAPETPRPVTWRVVAGGALVAALVVLIIVALILHRSRAMARQQKDRFVPVEKVKEPAKPSRPSPGPAPSASPSPSPPVPAPAPPVAGPPSAPPPAPASEVASSGLSIPANVGHLVASNSGPPPPKTASSLPGPPEKTDPLAELPRTVDLPEVPRPGAVFSPAPYRVSGLAVRPPEACQVELVGAAAAIQGVRRFVLASASAGPAWVVRCESPESGQEDVARLWLAEDALWFAWAPARDVPAGNLRYTALRIRADGKERVVALCRAVVAEPITLDLAAGVGVALLPLDPPPEPDALRLTITGVEGVPLVPSFDPSDTLVADGQTDVVFNAPGAPKVILRVGFPFKGRGTRLEVTAYYQLSDQPRLHRLTAAKVMELQNEARQLASLEKTLAAQAESAKGATSRQSGLLKQRLANVRAKREQLKNFDAFQAAVQSQVRVHYREFLAVDGAEIELVKTSLPKKR